MPRWDETLSATKSESTLLVLFIPSVDRDMQPIDQQTWLEQALDVLGSSFGGATAFPRARGVWRDDSRDGRLVYTSRSSSRQRSDSMAKNIERIAERLGAEIVGEVPDVGGGAFGAARLTSALRSRLVPSEGRRPGRPTADEWTRRDKVPMSEATYKRLSKVAAEGSTGERKIKVAAQLLEEAVKRL